MKGLSLPQLFVCATILYTSHVCISAERPHSVAAEFAAKAGIREVRKAIETGEGVSAVAEESFRAAMKAAPESEEGVTARIWLARIDLEKAQASSDTNKVKSNVNGSVPNFQKHFKPDDSSWQAKVEMD